MKIEDKSNKKPTITLHITYSDEKLASKAFDEIKLSCECRGTRSIERVLHVLEISRARNMIIVQGDCFGQTTESKFQLMDYLHDTLRNSGEWLECSVRLPYGDALKEIYHFWIDTNYTFRFSGTTKPGIDLTLGANPVEESGNLRRRQLDAQQAMMRDTIAMTLSACCYTCSAFNPDTYECDVHSELGKIDTAESKVCPGWWPEEHYLESKTDTDVCNKFDKKQLEAWKQV